MSLCFHAEEAKFFTPSQRELDFFGLTSGFYCTPANIPGIGLFLFALFLNKLFAIAS